MPSLRELQLQVMAHLLGESAEHAPALSEHALARVAAPRAVAQSRLQIHRNTLQVNFVDALGSTYPVVRRLVGEDYFRHIALDFQRCHPSRSGDLLHAGASFHGYVAELHATDEHRYLGEVARFEWLVQEALLAPAHSPLNLQHLAMLPPSAYDTLRFGPSPSLRMYESTYPCLRIWEANRRAETQPEIIDLRSGADRLALVRYRGTLECHRLDAGEMRFLYALQRGASFAAAIDAGGDARFDAAVTLQRFVATEIIVSFEACS